MQALEIFDLEENDAPLDQEYKDTVLESDSEEEIDDWIELELNFKPILQDKDLEGFIKLCENYSSKSENFGQEKNTWILLKILYDKTTRHLPLSHKTRIWLEEIYSPPVNPFSASEKPLLERVWQNIRKGRIEAAKEECRKDKEYWRAASIQTAESAHPPARFELWRSSCLLIASHPRSELEYVIYSVLARQFPRNETPPSPLLSSWEDQFWLSLILEKGEKEAMKEASERAGKFYNRVQMSILQRDFAELLRLLQSDPSRSTKRFGVHLFIYLIYQGESLKDEVAMEARKMIVEYLNVFYIPTFSSAIRSQFELLTAFFHYLQSYQWKPIIVSFLYQLSSLPIPIPTVWEKAEAALTKLNKSSPSLLADIPLLVIRRIVNHIALAQPDNQRMINSTVEWASIRYPRTPSALYSIINRILRLLILTPDHLKYARDYLNLAAPILRSPADLRPRENEEHKLLTQIVMYEWKQNPEYLIDAYRIDWKDLLRRLKSSDPPGKDRDRDSEESADEDALDRILRRYLPESVLLTLQHSPNQWKSIAMEIADESSAYFQLFSPEKLREFLLAIANIEISFLEGDVSLDFE